MANDKKVSVNGLECFVEEIQPAQLKNTVNVEKLTDSASEGVLIFEGDVVEMFFSA